MTILRAIAFNLAFYLWTAVMVVAYAPALLLPRRFIVAGQRRWARHVNVLLRTLAGIRFEERGRWHLPQGGYIVAAKHQSAWDTLIWHQVLDDPAVVMKQELLWIPIYGWMCRKSRMIPVDRRGTTAALRALVANGRRAVGERRPIVIFPQGTRTAPGTPVADVPYLPGVAALYRGLEVPVVPVALNSGLFWPRRSLRRQPGTILLEYLEPIPPGLDRRGFMAELQRRIETATARLEAEGRGCERAPIDAHSSGRSM